MRFSNAIKNAVFRLLTETFPTRSIFDACARAEPGNARAAVAPVARMSGSSIRELYSTRYCYAISGLHHSSIRREAFGFNHGFGGGLAQKIDHRAAAIGRRCGAR